MAGDITKVLAIWGAVGSTIAVAWMLYREATTHRMPPASPMQSQSNSQPPGDSEVKLYGYLVDQLHKYQTVIWQLPAVLVGANFLVIDKFRDAPWVLLALSILNAALIYVLQRMLFQQRPIIVALRNAEIVLREHFPAFMPIFPEKKLPAPFIFLAVLWFFDFALFAYSVNCVWHR